jgi:hypothetical protein
MLTNAAGGSKVEDRRKEDRRKLYGKPFLAMLLGGLPEDRRKGERRQGERRLRRMAWPPPGGAYLERRVSG